MTKQNKHPTPFNAAEWVRSMEDLGNRFYLRKGNIGNVHGRKRPDLENDLRAALHADDANVEALRQYLIENVDKYGQGPAPLGTEPLESLAHLETGIWQNMRFYNVTANDGSMQPRYMKGDSVRFFPWENASLRNECRDHVLHFLDGRLIVRELVKFKSAHIGTIDGVIVRSYHPESADEFIASDELAGIYPVIR